MVETIRDGDVARFADFDNRAAARGAARARTALKSLPVIDISPFVRGGPDAERLRTARALREACVDIGFFYLAGHGIPAAELDELIAWGHRFFELPLERKMQIHCSRTGGHQGYMTPGGMNPEANPDKAADLKERLMLNRERLPGEPDAIRPDEGETQWPDPQLLPGFEPFVKAQLKKRVVLAQQLVRALALSLELPENWFDGVYRYLRGNFIYNYYPSIDPQGVSENQWSFSPHTDYGVLTLLTQDSVGGLQARNVSGEWIDVPPVAGTFVVNVGDTLAMWTNDLYVSTLHRAQNISGVARISVPFFTSPQADTLIECLPTCHGPDNPPRYKPVKSEDYSRALVEQSRRSGRPGVSARTAERFNTRD